MTENIEIKWPAKNLKQRNKYKGLKEFLRLILFSFLENFGFRQLTSFYKVAGMLQYRRLKSRWGSIKRSAFTTSDNRVMSA